MEVEEDILVQQEVEEAKDHKVTKEIQDIEVLKEVEVVKDPQDSKVPLVLQEVLLVVLV